MRATEYYLLKHLKNGQNEKKSDGKSVKNKVIPLDGLTVDYVAAGEHTKQWAIQRGQTHDSAIQQCYC